MYYLNRKQNYAINVILWKTKHIHAARLKNVVYLLVV